MYFVSGVQFTDGDGNDNGYNKEDTPCDPPPNHRRGRQEHPKGAISNCNGAEILIATNFIIWGENFSLPLLWICIATFLLHQC